MESARHRPRPAADRSTPGVAVRVEVLLDALGVAAEFDGGVGGDDEGRRVRRKVASMRNVLDVLVLDHLMQLERAGAQLHVARDLEVYVAGGHIALHRFVGFVVRILPACGPEPVADQATHFYVLLGLLRVTRYI